MWQTQLRWRVVEARFEGQSWAIISRRLTIPERSCRLIYSQFLQFGTPYPVGISRRISSRRVMTEADDARLKAILDEDSNLFLDELAQRLSYETGKYISINQVLSSLQVRMFDEKPSFLRSIHFDTDFSLTASEHHSKEDELQGT